MSTPTPTATKYWKDKYENAVRCLLALGALLFVALVVIGMQMAELNSEEQIPKPERPAFDFNGQRCTTLRQEPEFRYRVDRQTVTLTVECAPELMLYYFEAKEE